MDSQDFARDYPWISYEFAMRIAAQHGCKWDAHDEIHFGSDIKTRNNHAEVNTKSFVLWLGY